MATRIYPKGVMAFKPHEKAAGFVKAALVITPDQLKEWCEGDGSEHMTDYKGNAQIKLQITEAQDGRYSVVVDTYRKPS